MINIIVLEEWKPILNYDNYEISTAGRVKNKIKDKYLNTYISTSGYKYVQLCLNKKRSNKMIHRLIAEAFIENPNNYKLVDHIDCDKLNNNILNLRWCNDQQNSSNKKISNKNKSGYKGVYFSNHAKKWCAQIKYNNKKIHIGYFIDIIDAAKAYNNKSLELNGEFANLNIIPEEDI